MRERHIRLTGINAMELQRYSKYPERRRGDCHAREATALIERYIRAARFRVRLAAQRASSRSGRRLRRSVWVRSGGRWRDLAQLELAAGHALWLPAADEWAHNLEYGRLGAAALAAQRNLYDPDFCGAGPDQDLPVSIVVNWDADGSDEGNLNGEYVDIRNGGARPLSLAGWFFRDSFLRYDRGRRTPGFAFPPSAVVPAGGSLRLRMGCGTNTARELHWCLDGTAFENVTGGPRHVGDGGYLFDPQRDLRASFLYPCLARLRRLRRGPRAARSASEPARGDHDRQHERGARRHLGPRAQAAQPRRGRPVRVRPCVRAGHRPGPGRLAALRAGERQPVLRQRRRRRAADAR